MTPSSCAAWARTFDRACDKELDETERDARLYKAMRSRFESSQEEAHGLLKIVATAAVAAMAQGVVAQAVTSGIRTAPQQASVALLISTFAELTDQNLTDLTTLMAAVQAERA